MKISGVLLDLDNTVYDYKRAHVPALAAALHWLGQELSQDPAAMEEAYASCRKRVNESLFGVAASHSRLLYFQGICERFGSLPVRLAPEAEDIYWTVFFENMQLRPGCMHFLQFLQELHLPLAIVSDLTARVQFDKIVALEIFPFVSAIVTSEESGHEKPHAEIFTHAAAKLNLAFSHLAMIGDSIERDIRGASALGMHCFWLETGLETEKLSQSEKEIVTVFSEFSQLPKLMQVHQGE